MSQWLLLQVPNGLNGMPSMWWWRGVKQWLVGIYKTPFFTSSSNLEIHSHLRHHEHLKLISKPHFRPPTCSKNVYYYSFQTCDMWWWTSIKEGLHGIHKTPSNRARSEPNFNCFIHSSTLPWPSEAISFMVSL